MLQTNCPNCTKETPFRHYNAQMYWYCQHCHASLSTHDLSEMSAESREKTVAKFPDATHFIEVEAEEHKSEESVIKVHPVAQNSNKRFQRNSGKGILVFNNTHLLGEVSL